MNHVMSQSIKANEKRKQDAGFCLDVESYSESMSDPKTAEEVIEAVFVSGKSLNIVRTSGMFSVENNGKEPKYWDVVHFADIGNEEEFVHFFSRELLSLVDGSMIFDEREQLKQPIAAVLIEGLMPAFPASEKHPRFSRPTASRIEPQAVLRGLHAKPLACLQRPNAACRQPHKN
jgi:hypothetical protein